MMERFLVGFHRQFTVHYADKSDGRYDDNAPIIRKPEDAFWYLPKDVIIKSLMEEGHPVDGFERTREEAEEEAEAGHEPGWRVFQLNAYIHGGVALSLGEFGCRWDSGQVGWVLVKEENEWGERDGKPITHEQIAQWLVDEWNQYLSGDVWYFSIEDSDGEETDLGAGGIYGREDALEIAKQHCPHQEDTKEVPVLVMFDTGQWTKRVGVVPVHVGDSKAPLWLMENGGYKEPLTMHEELTIHRVVLDNNKPAKESVA